MEQLLHKDTESLIKASYEKDGNTITVLSIKMKETKNDIDHLYEELEDISELYEQEKLGFEQEEASL